MLCGEHAVKATLNLRPQDSFANPKGYLLDQDHDTYYCSFKVPAPQVSGIYRIIVDDHVVYIGRAQCLKNRLSDQYGRVSPRHPFKGGQLQKCRTNAKINKALETGSTVVFRWEVCEDFKDRERRLLEDPTNRPPWNLRS